MKIFLHYYPGSSLILTIAYQKSEALHTFFRCRFCPKGFDLILNLNRSILFFQNTLVQDRAKELPRKDFLPALIQDLAPHFSFFPFSFVHMGPGSESFADSYRLQKADRSQPRSPETRNQIPNKFQT